MSRTYTLSSAVLLISLFAPAGDLSGQEIKIDASQVIGRASRYLTGACIEDVNHEIYGGIYSQMIFGESFQEPALPPPMPEVSGMWRPLRRGSARGRFALGSERPFAGSQSQEVAFTSGEGEWGVENQGLNRWGMNFVQGRAYEGYVWVRADKPASVVASLESRDGTRTYAERELNVTSNDWQRLTCTLTPNATDRSGRFALKLTQPGSIVLGHAFLQPGEWGRFKGLPARRDVALGLINQGITVLRYGGSMVNNKEYRWKKMIGPRDRRPPYVGHWYPYSSNGWGIVDFMDFCEGAGFAYVPDFNIDETPQDLSDFIEYAEGPADSAWGRKRVADGHPQPYQLPYMELGNEERVDASYALKFEALARAIWAKDRDVILVVGDFAYRRPIEDPMNITGAASKITNLAGHAKILELARKHDREVWFDVHVDTNGPGPSPHLKALPTYIDALGKVAAGAKYKVVVFEYNSSNHGVRRALGNALATNRIERDGRLPIVTSANGLQPDKQNDNGWDQGLLFFNPAQVWLQPPGYVTQMFARNCLSKVVKCEAADPKGQLDATAKRSEDGTMLVLQVVNVGDKIATTLQIAGFKAGTSVAQVTEISGPLDAVNSADKPNAIVPKQNPWKHEMKDTKASYTFPAHSFTIIRWPGRE